MCSATYKTKVCSSNDVTLIDLTLFHIRKIISSHRQLQKIQKNWIKWEKRYAKIYIPL